MENPDLTKIDEIIESVGRTPDRILPILQAMQKAYGYLPPAVFEKSWIKMKRKSC